MVSGRRPPDHDLEDLLPVACGRPEDPASRPWRDLLYAMKFMLIITRTNCSHNEGRPVLVARPGRATGAKPIWLRNRHGFMVLRNGTRRAMGRPRRVGEKP